MCGRAILLALICLIASGCATQTVSVRDRLLESAQRFDPDFPDGERVKLTRFAYIGSVTSRDGAIHVVWQDAAVLGMLSPRGIHAILYFDAEYNWLGRERQNRSSYLAPPMYTNGSRLFYYGLTGLGSGEGPNSDEAYFEGNVIDFADGFENRQVYFMPAYGSYKPDDVDGVSDTVETINPEGTRIHSR